MRCIPYRHSRLMPWRAATPLIQSETHLIHALQTAQAETVEAIVAATRRLILARDTALWDHHCGVAEYAAILAEALGWTSDEVAQVRAAGFLHDIGKLALPPEILDKQGSLTAAEFARVREHPTIGSRLLCATDAPDGIVTMVRDHHERWDGAGYPHGRAGAALSAGGRVLGVADALDAMLRDRPYAAGRSFAAAAAEIVRCAGQQFDPEVVAAFGRVVALYGPAHFTREMQVLPSRCDTDTARVMRPRIAL